MGFKSQLNHYQKMQLSQVKYLNGMAENRTKSTHLRREILQKQDQRNYRSEYERIRAHVEDSATPSLNKHHLRSKMAHFKN